MEMQVKTGRKERGQSMVELVLILPFLILLLAATVEAGFALRDYLMVQAVNREGARFAVRTPPGEENLDYFSSVIVGQVFDRVMTAADEGGLRSEDINIILTHIYVDADDAPVYDTFVHPITFDAGASRLDAQALSDYNATKEAEINDMRNSNQYESLRNEVVVVEVFYRHETVWGFDFVGAFGADWTMYTQSSMRMVGTGRAE
jgi:hypothetical protein